MSEAQRWTLAVLVDNKTGVLSQVSRLFSRKGYNIESLAVGTIDTQEMSRMTIEVFADENQIKLLCNQLRKLIPVYSVKLLVPDHSIRRELVMIKVKASDSAARNEMIQIANIFRASVLDISKTSLTLALIGEEEKADALQRMVEEFGILELVRTGTVALERGQYTINEETKEKGEFNYGKNVL